MGATYKVEIKYTGKPVVRFGEGIDYLTDYYEYPYKYDDGNITLIKA